MKTQNNYLLIALLFCFSFFACDEDSKGPLVADDTIPNAVSDVNVENLPGGAKITYDTPADEDLLYIEATFMRNGDQVSTRASIYKGFILIEGLNEVSSQEVSLRSVDRSENKSSAVTATIQPKKSPLQGIYESFEIVGDFGGARVFYDNPIGIRFELLFYVIENGQKVYQTSDFIEDEQSTSSVFRGYDPVPYTFGVEAVDRWSNITPLFQAEITPFEEFLLAREEMEGLELPTDELTRFGWTLNNLFNGTFNGGGFHTDQTSPGTIIPPYTEGFHTFTIDMGSLAKLSRIKFWHRAGNSRCCGTPFGHGDPRFFEIWGVDEIPADNGATFNGWTKLVENGEVIKPSGAPFGTHSAEDLALSTKGLEFETPSDAPPVRYIRFVNQENWSGTKFVHIMQYEFYGQPL